jgi:ATP-dependent Clp protease adaptor protein ClpS
MIPGGARSNVMPQTTNTPQVTTVTRPEVTTNYVVTPDADLEKPYRVIIQNDDVTPMEFVVLILRGVFALTIDRAMQIMLDAHHNGRALVKLMPYAEARESVYQAQHLARENGYPLMFYLEPDA